MLFLYPRRLQSNVSKVKEWDFSKDEEDYMLEDEEEEHEDVKKPVPLPLTSGKIGWETICAGLG